MGQYYNAVLKDKNGQFHSYYGDGVKLMEHSYFGNRFVNYICKEILNNPTQIAWVGDYAETKDYKENLHQFIENRVEKEMFAELDDNFNTLGLTLVNHTKKVYIRMTYYYNLNVKNNEYFDDWVIHPLPLLTAMGNGLGGGDYEGINMNLVGCWAGDLIEIIDLSKLYRENYQEYTNFTKDYKDVSNTGVLFKERG